MPYDFTNLTQKQIRALADKLYQSGQISFQETGFLGAIGPIGPAAPANIGSVADLRFNALSSLETTISSQKNHPQANLPISAMENILTKLQ